MAAPPQENNQHFGNQLPPGVTHSSYNPANAPEPPEPQNKELDNLEDADNGDDADDDESDDDADKEQRADFLSAGGKHIDSGAPLDIPEPAISSYEQFGPEFAKFWTNKDTFDPTRRNEINKIIRKANEDGKVSRERLDLGLINFAAFDRHKKVAIDNLSQSTDLRAWKNADDELSKLTQLCKISRYPITFAPPKDFLERCLNLKRPGQDKDGAENISEDNTPEGLSSGGVAQIPIRASGTVEGYLESGAIVRVIIGEGKSGMKRYRLVPQRAVKDFSKTTSTNLVDGQRARNSRGTNRDKYGADIAELDAVAWIDAKGDDNNPLAALDPDPLGGRLPITMVKIKWKGGETSWETRTTLRQFYPRASADAIIYERARRAELKYREGTGLPYIHMPARSMASVPKGFSILSSNSSSRAVPIEKSPALVPQGYSAMSDIASSRAGSGTQAGSQSQPNIAATSLATPSKTTTQPDGSLLVQNSAMFDEMKNMLTLMFNSMNVLTQRMDAIDKKSQVTPAPINLVTPTSSVRG